MSPVAQANAPASNALEYSPPLPLRRRSIIRRGIVAVLILYGVAILVYEISAIIPFVRIYSYERQCLAHPIPPATIVYASGNPPVSSASPELARLQAACVSPIIPPVRWFKGRWPMIVLLVSRMNRATLYIGQRRAPNGLTRFIGVNVLIGSSGWNEVSIDFDVVNLPAGYSDQPSDCRHDIILGYDDLTDQEGAYQSPGPALVVYSASEDPADPSHFSFEYHYRAWYNKVDFRLQPDGLLRTEFSRTLSPAYREPY
jgi:hypothetical protein